jgi:hypothetical protein
MAAHSASAAAAAMWWARATRVCRASRAGVTSDAEDEMARLVVMVVEEEVVAALSGTRVMETTSVRGSSVAWCRTAEWRLLLLVALGVDMSMRSSISNGVG